MINADIQNTEYPFLKLPYEYAVKSLKKMIKQTEKEISSVLNSIIQLKKENNFEKKDVQYQIQQLIHRLYQQKEKLNQDSNEQLKIYQSCSQRVNHLNSINETKESQNQYHSTRNKRLLIEQLTRNKNIQIAKKLSQNLKLDNFCDMEINIIQNANKIIDSLKNQNIDIAFQWCLENKSKLEKLKSDFQFRLIQQKFIQFLKNDQIQNGRIYFQQHSQQYKDNYISEIKKLFMCILFNKNIDKYPQYQYYFNEQRWNDLIEQFKSLYYKIYGLTSNSQLNTCLQAGISCLKVLNCQYEKFQCPDKCPICSPFISKLSENVPGTHKVISTLICRITNDVINEDNYALILNNNQVFSEKGVKLMIQQKNNVCPITKKYVDWQDTRKIFLS
ncbi:hypothetical protein IMG5_166230 [Ichthyophthirius multifiliis]|uniref:CTLH domain-containing protein n=1 Tax=Ichthyophthirius multifiliis TaxID=5932 RepID=G0R0Q6_ICHMU|nr:hypothetical protein IMG5_166230 [Ichthyophthirius multifiliis]EGR28956.1 hypothetical protein IMG5_166230 [Ichthyophthirius multifiliis]|eukprot:XP_004030192.1 hypothetical protein IMG5_166230 [Ichthyophthirius multifiliis]